MKAHNLNRARQIQENKRAEVLAKKRLGSRHGPPKLVGIIPISPDVDLNSIAVNLGKECKPCRTIANSLPFIQTMSAQVEKREARFTFMVAPRDPVAVADIAKVADIIYLVASPKDDNEEFNVDMLGNHFMQIIKAQGMPAILGVTQGVASMDKKMQQAVNRLANRYFHTVFGDEVKVFNIDTESDTKNILRWSFHTLPRPITWRDDRTRLLGENIEYIRNKDYDVAQQAQGSDMAALYNPTLGTLRVTGFLRGDKTLSANQLVHITGFGDYQILMIEGYSEDTPIPHLKKGEEFPKPRLLSRITEEHEPMQDLLPVNTLGNEQSVITDEELQEAVAMNPQLQETSDMFTRDEDGNVVIKTFTSTANNTTFNDWRDQNLPFIQSMSSLSSGTAVMAQNAPVLNEEAVAETKGLDNNGIIQSVWESLDIGEEEEAAPAADDDDMDMAGVDEGEMDYLAAKQEKKALRKEVRVEEGFDENMSNLSNLSNLSGFSMGSLRNGCKTNEEVVARFADLPYKEKVRRLLKYGTKGEDRLAKEKRRMERTEVSNKDEVDFDPSITARARFARYRGMKSFKHSAWDHNENLPTEYSQIFQFANFEVSMRNAKDACEPTYEDLDDEMALGGRPINGERATPVIITIANVAAEAAEMMMAGRAFALLWGLYRHERKVTVMHTLVKRHNEYTMTIKGKDPMHVQVGFRRFTTAPIYSKIVTGTDKTLVERFFPNDEKFYLASFYGRVIFPPASVLMFPAHVLGSYKEAFPFNPLAASGTLQSCNPNKIILKRSVLTGFPITVSKRNAVVRHMFYNANDVRWFKPVELWTKSGRHGHILEPRGLHGLFKCQFDNTLKTKEAICMSLYKRQFPPWNPAFLG